MIGASLKLDAVQVEARVGADAATVLREIQASAWVSIPALMVVISVAEWARRSIGSPNVWRVVRDVLGNYRNEIFDDRDGEHMHAHRVTLFRYQKWLFTARCWPWTGWLVPVERSGHTTQKTNIAFMAPDDAERAEGIAGMTWSARKIICVKDLPCLTSSSTEEDLQAYSAKSLMPLAIVKKRMPKARSLMGLPVEVKNEIWGVVVVDSQDPQFRDYKVRKSYDRIARFLGKTLEGL